MPGPDDFIELYPGAIASERCRAIVDRFEASERQREGRVGGGVFPDLKRSTDIAISGLPEWQDVALELGNAAFRGMIAYLRRYPSALISPLMLERPDGEGGRRRLVAEDVATMPEAELAKIAARVFRPGAINLQRYRAGEGGYPYWHCELYPRGGDATTLHRHLLWTIYLNQDFSAGETEFLHQSRKVAPQTGALLIAPTAFTHTHRGNRPEGGDKYIATSWILFQPAERMLG